MIGTLQGARYLKDLYEHWACPSVSGLVLATLLSRTLPIHHRTFVL